MLALLVGAWSLMAQFIFNRIIFFYVANSEYTAATIITLHLTGFWLGAAAARRWTAMRLTPLVTASLGLVVAIDVLVWRLGILAFGLPLTVSMAALGGLALAGLSGAVVVRLMQAAGKAKVGQGVVVADTAGSVFGALVGGFILLPVFGIRASFVSVAALQVVALAMLLWPARRRAITAVVGGFALLTAMAFGPTAADKQNPRVVAAEGMIITPKKGEKMELLYSARSPYGLVSVVEQGEEAQRVLNIDGRPLCVAAPGNRLDWSAWETGAWPVARLDPAVHKGHVANVGLGCGMTMAGMLDKLPRDGTVDVIEINPVMPAAQRYFDKLLPHTAADPRVRMVFMDGFRYFAERTPGGDPPLFDAVAIDVAWMQNMNATHLFSVEMYRNVKRNLHPQGVVSVWSEETTPFSPVSQIMYATLREVFPNVVMSMVSGVVLFHASPERTDLGNYLPEGDANLSDWVEQALLAMPVPVNRLNNLVMNRHKFTPWGDSTWERLFRKYSHM